MFQINDNVESKGNASHDVEGTVIDVRNDDGVEMIKVSWTLSNGWYPANEFKMVGEETVYDFENDVGMYKSIFTRVKEAFERYCEEDGITDWYEGYEMTTFETNEYSIVLIMKSTNDEKNITIPKDVFADFYEV